MFPVLFTIGQTQIYSYGFFIALGYIAALLLGRYLAHARRLEAGPFMDLAFLAIVSGVLGARLLFVLQNWEHYLATPAEILDVWGGGLVFYGGFLLAAFVCYFFVKWKKLPPALTADIATAGLALAHGLGRIGCFAAGCCYGNACPYPWAIHNETSYVDPEHRGAPIHPVQLYEAFLLFALAGLLTWLIRRRKTPDGFPALVYLTGYAGIRFVTEMFRGDADRGFVAWGWLSLSQGFALFLFVLGSGILVRRLRS